MVLTDLRVQGSLTSGQVALQRTSVQPGVQMQLLRSSVHCPPFRHESQLNSQSGPNVPGIHSVETRIRIKIMVRNIFVPIL